MYFSLKKLFNVIGISSFLVLMCSIIFGIAIYSRSHSSIGITHSDESFMNMAYEESELALKSNDYPVGAVLVINGKTISRAHNEVRLKNDYRNHAEMIAINEALNLLKISHFGKIEGDVRLYTTFEPCSMCEGFIIWKKVPRIIVGKNKSPIYQIKRSYWHQFIYRLNMRGGINEEKFDVLNNKYHNLKEPKGRKLKDIRS